MFHSSILFCAWFRLLILKQYDIVYAESDHIVMVMSYCHEGGMVSLNSIGKSIFTEKLQAV